MHRKLVQRGIIAAICAGVLAWFVWPRNASLRGFDPVTMANVEAGSWRHYYEKRWASLFCDLYRGARNEYRFSPCDSCLIALHAARAAKVFQPSHSREEARKAIPLLEDYFAVIRDGTGESFDITLAASQELEWWQLRRENKSWQEYGRAISAATATLYKLPAAALEKGCLKRAEMMDLRDQKGKRINEDDWRAIEAGLREAWTLTKSAVSQHDG